MELVLAAAAAAAVLWLASRGASTSGGGGSGSSGSGTSGGSGSGSAGSGSSGSGGSSSQGSVLCSVLGGDGYGALDVIAGGQKRTVYGTPQTFYFDLGTEVTFHAWVQGGIASFGTGFDHFQGPGGVQTTADTFTAQITGSGFVQAVFATFGIVGF